MIFTGLWCWGLCMGWSGNTIGGQESCQSSCWGRSFHVVAGQSCFFFGISISLLFFFPNNYDNVVVSLTFLRRIKRWLLVWLLVCSTHWRGDPYRYHNISFIFTFGDAIWILKYNIYCVGLHISREGASTICCHLSAFGVSEGTIPAYVITWIYIWSELLVSKVLKWFVFW